MSSNWSEFDRKWTLDRIRSMFLVSLAVADLLLVGVCAPLETMNYFLNRWTNFTVRTRLCQLQSYVEMLSPVASVLNMTAVSLERFTSIFVVSSISIVTDWRAMILANFMCFIVSISLSDAWSVYQNPYSELGTILSGLTWSCITSD